MSLDVLDEIDQLAVKLIGPDDLTCFNEGSHGRTEDRSEGRHVRRRLDDFRT